MKTLGVLGIVIVVSALFLGGVIAVAGYCLSVYNTQAKLQTLYDAKVKDNSSEFDNMWKKISQVSQVPAAKKDALKDIFSSYADARSGNKSGGQMMQWIHESVPNVDLNTYDNLMNIITTSRDSWTERQKELVDISREFNQNLATQPSGALLHAFGFKEIDAKVITSSRTEQTFQSGKDDDTNLFPASK